MNTSLSIPPNLARASTPLLFSLALISLCLADHCDASSSAERYRGVCFVGGRPIQESHIADLEATGVDWISQTPFGWQRKHDSPAVSLVTNHDVYWGEGDLGLVETAELARERGIKTLLKPHIWLLERGKGFWSGSIEMNTEADWQSWFQSYEDFILHYARIAEENGMDGLCVATELENTAHREREWRRVIASVREVYSGPLTYAANWSGEYRKIAFWDALDFIGVQAYFPLADNKEFTVEELVEGWAPHRDSLRALSERTGKRIAFTEIGYRSTADAAIEPWLWRTGAATSLDDQARCYQATFEAIWDEPWFLGTFWWKWFPHWNDTRSSKDRGYTPQGKPAAMILSKWYLENSSRTAESGD